MAAKTKTLAAGARNQVNAYIKTLVDGKGNQILPRTRAKAVMTESGVTAEEKFAEIAGELGGISTAVAKARPNIIGIYPVAEGQAIAAGDVVDVQADGTVTKADTPSQCIALQSGEAGQKVEVIFDGVAELPGAAAGREITSPGVYGYCPKDGWLWVRPEWDNASVSGSYTGTGLFGASNENELTLPFRPRLFFVTGTTGAFYANISDFEASTNISCIGIKNLNGVPVLNRPILNANGTTVFWFASDAVSQCNEAGYIYHYSAFR